MKPEQAYPHHQTGRWMATNLFFQLARALGGLWGSDISLSDKNDQNYYVGVRRAC